MRHTQSKRKKSIRIRVISGVVALLFVGFLLAALLHIGAGSAQWAGMTVSDINATLAVEFNLTENEQGVVVHWVSDEAYNSGVREGDVIKGINNMRIRNVHDFLLVAEGIDLSQGALLDVVRDSMPMYISLRNELGFQTGLKAQIGATIGSYNSARSTVTEVQPSPIYANIGTAPQNGATPIAATTMGAPNNPLLTAPMPISAITMATPRGGATAVAFRAPMTAGALPTPKQQQAAKKTLVEGHWLGMELIGLIPELAKEFKIPKDIKGLLVDEVCLESAEAGLLAGDLVLSVEGVPTPDLVEFTEATRRVKNQKSAELKVWREGKVLEIEITSTRTIGFSQNETAQPIAPGALSPHRKRGSSCTACHVIMITGGQLPIDAGDILAPSPPPIPEGATPPHGNRGECESCHIILAKNQTQAPTAGPVPIPKGATPPHGNRGECKSCHVIF